MELLQANDFVVRYKSGKINVVADALSRQPHLALVSTVQSQLIENQQLISEYQNDKYFGPIFITLQHLERANQKEIAQAHHFELINNLLYLKQGPRMAIPNNKELRTKLLQEYHDNVISGHLGVEKTTDALMKYYYWPRMNKTVYKYVTSCDECQRNKGRTHQPFGLLQPLTTPTRRWEQVTMDFIVQLPLTKKKHDAIIVFVD